ncbi:MAG: hypothetical protein JWO56_3212, partial [Acidobacteria bacterium]|nr:hypothetical protein [Acidobacteriota bacterium]
MSVPTVPQLRLVGTKRSEAPSLDAPYALDPLQVVGLFAGIGGI